MFEYFNEKAIKVISLAQEEARRSGHNLVGTEYILLGLILEGNNNAAVLLKNLGVTAHRIREKIEQTTGKGAGFSPLNIPFTPKSKKILEEAFQTSRQLASSTVEPEHILLAITSEPECLAAKILQDQGVNLGQVRTTIIREAGEKEAVSTVGGRQSSSERNYNGQQKTGSLLAQYGTNLTEKAIAGKLDPIIGREPEIERTLQILARRTKNNPILLGEPGVGKTAIAEGIAQKLIQEDVPDFLQNKQVVSLEISSLLAGTRLRGEFEERVKTILQEVIDSTNIILFIDEIHTIIGTGALGGTLDIANMFKPALARGQLQCIGATTLSEYRTHIEKDAALERRFQPVKVGEPTPAQALEIIQGLRKVYEDFHKIKFTEEALEASVTLSDRYISDRFLPDKAIDLIDEAGSRAHLRHSLAAKQQSDSLINPQSLIPVVDTEEIAEIVSAWTNIPVMQLTESETDTLVNLEAHLHERIIGQNEAVKSVANAVRRARVGMKPARRPTASFIFAGPTGVGKTELAKALASFIFGSEEAMIRLDMSEYMESHTISKLIGSPPGYVGYGDGGQLTEAVRRKPYSVILLDEIEKAHPDVFNLFLQVLDDGRLTDSQGRVINFQNTLIIMTSNLGSKVIEKGATGLGFNLDNSTNEADYNRLKNRVMDEFKQYFRPEFLNRLDEVIVFRQLTKDEVTQIADILLAQVSRQLKEQRQITLEVTPAFKSLVVSEGYNPSYGARPLRRAITARLEDSLAEAILRGQVEDNSSVLLDVNEQGEVTVSPTTSVLDYQTIVSQ